MPTITTGNPDACKGSNNNYLYDATQGVAQSYTINTHAGTGYWFISKRTNCNFSVTSGAAGASVTVTPTNYWGRLGYWSFQAQYSATDPSPAPLPPESADNDMYSLVGGANVAGALTITQPSNITYGVRVFNSLGNIILDVNSVQPRIIASGGPVSVGPNTAVQVTVPGLVADGTSQIFLSPTSKDAAASFLSSYTYLSGVPQNDKFTLQNYNSGNTYSTYWTVVRL